MRKNFKIFSATSFQIIFNQLFGLLFFVFLSSGVGKDIFGDLNWSVAVSVTLFVILTLGFDYIVVRNISAGQDPECRSVGIYLTHVVVVSAICVLALAGHRALCPGFYITHNLFVPVFISIMFSFICGPFKQLSMGKEKFWHLALMNVIANFVKITGLLFIMAMGSVTVTTISILFVTAGAIELLVCALAAAHILHRPPGLIFNYAQYAGLVRVALPQTGTVLLDSAFARMDWILMGLLSTKAFTADYSFAYKAFESSRIPLLIIAPVLLPRLSRLYGKEQEFSDSTISQLNALWKAESLISMIVPLALNVCWITLVNLFTHNKYGEDTAWVYLILSMGIPMLFINNYLWTIAFANGRLKLTFVISAIVTASNLVLNIILIPYYHAIGAAIASTASIFIQMALYGCYVRERRLNLSFPDFVRTFAAAGLVLAAMRCLRLWWLLQAVVAVLAFLVAMLPFYYRLLRNRR